MDDKPNNGRGGQSPQPAKCSAALVASRITILLSAYRRDDYADPDGFVVQLGAVLEKYPEWVVRYVTEPTTGVQRTCKFPPSIAEVVAACEDIYAGERFSAQWDQRARQQIEERRQLPNWAQKPRGAIITWEQAQAMVKENPAIKIRGVSERG